MSDDAAIYIEMMPVGNAVEVAAIHSETGREVRFVVPAWTSEHDIKQLARSKMEYVMRKEAEDEEDLQQQPPKKDPRGGIIV